MESFGVYTIIARLATRASLLWHRPYCPCGLHVAAGQHCHTATPTLPHAFPTLNVPCCGYETCKQASACILCPTLAGQPPAPAAHFAPVSNTASYIAACQILLPSHVSISISLLRYSSLTCRCLWTWCCSRKPQASPLPPSTTLERFPVLYHTLQHAPLCSHQPLLHFFH
jgi:hypothetical protein